MSLYQRGARFIARHPIATTTAACLSIATLVFIATYVSIWYLNGLPHRLDQEFNDKEERTVSLLSRSGKVIHTWNSHKSNGIAFAKIMRRPDSMGGGRIVAIGYKKNERSELAGALCVYELNHPESPLWTSGTGPPQINVPEPISHVQSDQFRFVYAKAADVFESEPAQEIIALHWNKGYSPTLIRVYNLAGEVLYEAWHDGDLNGVAWLARHELLVTTGVNSEERLDELGEASNSGQVYPLVVFALRPEVGHRSRRWITPRDQPRSVRAVWYRCIRPFELYGEMYNGLPFSTSVQKPAGIFSHRFRNETSNLSGSGVDYESHFTLSTIRSDDRSQSANIRLLMSHTGRLVDRRMTSSYKGTYGTDLDLEAIELGDLPPISTSMDLTSIE